MHRSRPLRFRHAPAGGIRLCSQGRCRFDVDERAGGEAARVGEGLAHPQLHRLCERGIDEDQVECSLGVGCQPLQRIGGDHLNTARGERLLVNAQARRRRRVLLH